MTRLLFTVLLALMATRVHAGPVAAVQIKEFARVGGARDNPLTGYGLVFGLAGSGDSPRSAATVQSVANTLKTFGVNVDGQSLSTRNVAAVIVTARLPAFAEPGTKLDVQVSSAGDARSLNGGTLMLAPLTAPDGRVYALAQGAISVGGYQFEAITASVQKNHPTVGWIPSGATIERAAPTPDDVSGSSMVSIVLNQPDFTLARRVAQAVSSDVRGAHAHAVHAGRVDVTFSSPLSDPVNVISDIEGVLVVPERRARVVINERTGTIVAGSDVRLGAVSISHGDLRVEISTEYQVSQPDGVFLSRSYGVQSVVVPKSTIKTDEPAAAVVSVKEGATVSDLVTSLKSLKLSTRDVIAIMQSIKSAGALDGELIIE
ncbi:MULTISPECIES: flagellar basal body P-ring protein FlgI [Pseudoxanthomonas]|uniref:Flagellar P-ring protein n=1 Tax=Pseudoxanthomonas winnipegensis TaxID=2480810 RepID=A0AAW8GE06_9GAMM|nr:MULTISPECIES: flagellar basal body P-ring protein FlgI [Pseudoxanthomonas]MDQ1120674.1 flagellar P-ring protein precursor FlgI [Pseudoxanthomonas winnipegensis]MDQ1133897.1 flagellar P-ring protein precursor FlgI [Pseudoxanthomonas winnipegensis]MDR6139867.1 flagellar P-ring protein precursor FlgI [Pseudoxanthomonas sp. SORGH_AS_0997]